MAAFSHTLLLLFLSQSKKHANKVRLFYMLHPKDGGPPSKRLRPDNPVRCRCPCVCVDERLSTPPSDPSESQSSPLYPICIAVSYARLAAQPQRARFLHMVTSEVLVSHSGGSCTADRRQNQPYKTALMPCKQRLCSTSAGERWGHVHDGADVRDPRGSGGTLRSVLLIKAFTFPFGSGILFDLDWVKSISDNEREVLAFAAFGSCSAPALASQRHFSNNPLVSAHQGSGATGSSCGCKIAS